MPFVKGQSGNPGGRPAGKPFADALRMEIAASGDNHKALRQIAKVLLAQAKAGDMEAIRELANRLDGKPTQQIEASITETKFALVPETADRASWEQHCAEQRNEKHH